ncbi:hypothetical protein WJX75_001357 [Coccomyxa subellipsoidea]|uniref:Pescadillo homolog n=1 Tax=Coccomyxa subellipsoidea TaxID=248742 RepID=A0ABR2YX60_9CHLO
MGPQKKRGQAGNAVQYITRNQALKRLQLKLSEFRRLCILKGIHPREPKKKTQGQNKTYYHVKDINFLAHEPLLNKLRDEHVVERKIRKARAKKNRDLAERLAALRPKHRLDHLVKERYPSFVDALRDLDDPLTLVHLFATLPAEEAHKIPAKAVATSRRLALEWQAWVVRTSALRRTFVSVKGFYFQADVMGQPVTWLVPHATSQVLPMDVDYRVMLTFLEFHHTMLQFVNYKLYHALGVRYPPVVDPKLEEAAAGLSAIMQDLAKGAGARLEAAKEAGEAAAEVSPEVAQRMASLPAKLKELQGQEIKAAQGAQDMEEAAEAGSSDEDVGSISSGEDEDEDEEPGTARPDADEDMAEAAAEGRGAEAGALVAAEPDTEGAAAAGGAADVDADDDAGVCAALFRGLVFFLGREVPREALLLVIRSFGGTVGWQGEGSPIEESDESITHQVVDRPTQGHRFLSRQYVQPQWVLDSANFRVLADAELYAPGCAPPPHLSPFVDNDDEGYVPDYARTLHKLQEAAGAARRRAAGQQLASMFGEDAPEQDTTASVEDDVAEAERLYTAELQEELRLANAAADAANAEAADASVVEPAAASTKGVQKKGPTAEEVQEEEDRMAAAVLPRKKRNLYNSIQKRTAAKKARVQELEQKRARLGQE